MKHQLFNDRWTAEKDGISKPVTLPHDAMIMEEKDPECPNGGRTGYYPGGNYVYRKTFAASNDRTVYLEFDGIYKDAQIYLNDCHMKSVHYGYSRILVDLSEQICKNGRNELAVYVNNSNEKNSRWYTGSGIYRDVHVMYGDNLYIRPNGIRITTDEADVDLAALTVCTWMKNKAESDKQVNVIVEIFDEEHRRIISEKTSVTVMPAGSDAVGIYPDAEGFCRQHIYIRNPKLWSDETPYLYTCQVSVYDKDILIDSEVVRTGIRQIRIDPVYGLRINNRQVKLRGGCLHHDLGILGAASFEEAECRRIQKLKAAGYNAVRMSHHPMSSVLLEVCDRYGMYVMDEAFDMWALPKNENDYHLHFETTWADVIEDMVAKDYNHPCVIMYSIGNEIHELGTPEGRCINRNLVEKVHQLDSSRPVTQAINGMTVLMDKLDKVIPMVFTREELEERHIQLPITDINDALTILLDRTEKMNALDLVTDLLSEVCGALDVVGYNYATGRYSQDHELFPSRVLMGSETFPSEIAGNWEVIKNQPYILGEFTWAAWDYIGETGIGTIRYNCTPDFSVPYPCGLADTGDFDIIGDRKAISYYREAVWHLDRHPFIGIQDPAHFGQNMSKTGWGFSDVVPSWTWNGFEGKPVHAEIYSSADEVELFVNGQSVGKKPAGSAHQYKAEYDITFEPGNIEAVAYKNGMRESSKILETAESVSRVLVKRADTPDQSLLDESWSRKTVKQNGLIILEIGRADNSGRLNMCEDDTVTVCVSGAGKLQGFGNADPYDVTGFNKKVHHTWHGRALAAVRAGNETGNIEVIVSSPNCEDIRLNFEVM